MEKIRLLLCREKIFNFFKTAAVTVFVLLLSASCSGRGDGYNGKEAYYSYSDTIAAAPQPDALRSAEVMRSSVAEKSLEAAPEAEERKKTFSAGCTVQTASPAEAIMEASIIAQRHGGWLESSGTNDAVLRVPVSQLSAVFEKILELGRVIDKYLESEDVTDRYTDLESRLAVLSASKSRLETLLSAATGTDEKIKIFREIRRINDQIEQIKIQLESLERDIEYSVIRVNFIPFGVYDGKLEIPFRWMRSLDPFNSSINIVYRKVIVSLPDDYAVLDKKRYFHAETPDGVILRIGTVDNKPYGDAGFWQKALEYHLKGFFSSSENMTAGKVQGVLFRGKDSDRFAYFTGILLIRRLIFVVEIYFPDSDSYDNRSHVIFKALEGLDIK